MGQAEDHDRAEPGGETETPAAAEGAEEVTPRTTFGPLLVAGILAGNLLAWLTGWQVPW